MHFPTALKLASFILVLFLSPQNVRMALALSSNRKRCILDEAQWKLEPREEIIQSISNLTDDYLGFNNRTCTTSLASRKTAGPVMRQSNKSKMWYDWLVRVEGSLNQNTGSIAVSFQAFIDPKVAEDAYCLGFISTFYDSPGYGSVCSLAPYGTGMFMNSSMSCPMGQVVDAQRWLVQPVGDSGEIEILATKPGACARAVAVQDCKYQPILVNYPVTENEKTNTYTKWKLIKRYDLVPITSPSPPPQSPLAPSPPPPPGPIPGPRISAPSSTSSGNVNIVVNEIGGNSRCQVKSISITVIGSPVGAVSKTVEVSASAPALSTAGVPVFLSYNGYNSLYAFSICSTGERTMMSNQLTIFSLTPVVPVVGYKAPTGVLFALQYSNTSVDCDGTDKSRVCENVLALQGGGTCSILSLCSPPADLATNFLPVGTVSYQSQQEASTLVQKLNSNPSVLLDGPWGACGWNFTVVTTVVAIADSLPNPTIIPDPPTVISASFISDCSHGIEIKFTPPTDTTGILAYAAKCYPQLGRRRGLKAASLNPVFGITEGASSTSILLEGAASADQTCEMWSFTVDSESAASNSVDAIFNCI